MIHYFVFTNLLFDKLEKVTIVVLDFSYLLWIIFQDWIFGSMTMRRSFIYLFLTGCFLFYAFTAMAHSLLLYADDNGDGTVSLEAIYSTEEIPVYAKVLLKDKQGHVFWRGEIDEYGLCTYKKPDIPYTVFVDAGPGHTAETSGP